MKKILSLITIIILLFLSGCSNTNKDDAKNLDQDIGNSNETENHDKPLKNSSQAPEDSKDSIKNYYPVFSNKEYVYDGSGNEYASYNIYIDYFDMDTNRVQTRTYNGGTDLAKVIENKDGKLSIIYFKEEAYYRDNKLNAKVPEEGAEVLLMEPLIKGTQWTLNDQRKRSITNIDTKIDTPLGSYQALEVTTKEPNDGITKDYYAPGIGLIKSIFLSEGNEITSTLSEIKENIPLTNKVKFFYPNEDQEIYLQVKDLSFNTNDITRIILQKEMSKIPPKDNSIPLISEKTKINYMYLGKDHIAYIDFSRDLVDDMNVGASYESLILQSIANTIGNYYNTEKVYLTIDGKPYESGHLSFKKGELLTVNLDGIVN